MKKKLFALTMVVCLLAAISLTACGKANPYVDLNFEEYVKLGKYTGLTREEIKVSVSDEEVQTQIKINLQETATTVELTEGKVQSGDLANIDYEGKLNGETFQGGTAKGYDLQIGSGTFIAGFEEGLIGKEIGGTYDLSLTFPADYGSAELAGKDVVFTVTINHVDRTQVSEYTVEWIKANSDVDTKEDYEKLVRDQLIEDKTETEKNNIIAGLWNQVVANSTIIVYPEDIVNDYVKEIEEQYEYMADQYGVDLQTLWIMQGIDSQETYDAKNIAAAQVYVKEQMVMFYIAQKEGLTYTEEEADGLRNDIKKAGYNNKTFKRDYGQDIDTYIDSALTFSKVSEFIYENAVVK